MIVISGLKIKHHALCLSYVIPTYIYTADTSTSDYQRAFVLGSLVLWLFYYRVGIVAGC
jgi:hypothetical protein